MSDKQHNVSTSVTEGGVEEQDYIYSRSQK